MKTTALIRHIAAAAAFALAAASLPAADNASAASPLPAPAPVYNQPAASAAVINTLAAGVTPAYPAGESTVALPSGWLAVELAGPHTIYVRDTDLNKQLDPKPGVALRLEPKTDGPVLATMEKGDTVELTGQKGRWIQFQLNRPVIGYIQSAGGTAAAEVTSDKSQVASAPAAATSAAPAAPRTAATPAPSAAASTPSVPAATSTDAIAPLPRSLKGIFASTRRAFAPRRPYDYQLNDDAGNRYTYLDVSKLVMTEQIEKYVGRGVIIYGLAEAVPNTKDIVIRVETLQLAK
ncbi:SH3 domain-containing protein [Termitidicoccus mucosus]|uniref:SH3b domain-containing protein n=1 Tax=Termitidicoccus mucosus TaxID=1184151 RepID=A0A178IF03_9BACT|nr:hypothetical protein AW736_22090 [Opitutaceae bacterium TSB47]